MAQPSESKATRRDFLKLGVAGAAGVAAGPFVSRNAQAKPVSITFARESAYVKNFDEHFQKVMAPAYEKATGIKIEYLVQAAGGGAVPQLVSMVENKSGADLAWVQQEWLYREALVDVSDIADAVGKEYGGWYDEIKLLSVDHGKWKSVPHGNIGQLMVYRKDWFEEAGIKTFPDTWDEFLEAGTKLKAKGHPFGMSMGHGFGDVGHVDEGVAVEPLLLHPRQVGAGLVLDHRDQLGHRAAPGGLNQVLDLDARRLLVSRPHDLDEVLVEVLHVGALTRERD
jgi:multiple sugar transport system substrate-binding protein